MGVPSGQEKAFPMRLVALPTSFPVSAASRGSSPQYSRWRPSACSAGHVAFTQSQTRRARAGAVLHRRPDGHGHHDHQGRRAAGGQQHRHQQPRRRPEHILDIAKEGSFVHKGDSRLQIDSSDIERKMEDADARSAEGRSVRRPPRRNRRRSRTAPTPPTSKPPTSI